MSAYTCSYRGGPAFDSDYIPTGADCQLRADLPKPTVKVSNGPATDYGNSPSGPTPDVVYPVVSPNGDDSATPPAADGTATTGRPGGCCADGSADCWKCWVRDHWQWLLILALGLAAYLTRKK